jgi:hypothetical protein
VQLNDIASLFGQFNKIKLGLSIDTKIIFFAKMNFRTPFSCADFVSFNNWKIYISLFKTVVASPLYKHISIDIAQPGITVTVILCVL